MTKTIHIPPELHWRVRVAAANAGVNISDFVADLLRSGLGATPVDHCKPGAGAGAPQRSRARRRRVVHSSQSEAPDAVTPEAPKADSLPVGGETERAGRPIPRLARPVRA